MAIVLMVTDGAVASTLYLRPADALLPFTLVTLTCTLASPSSDQPDGADGTVAVHLPSGVHRGGVALPPKVMVTVWFSSTFEVVPRAPDPRPLGGVDHVIGSDGVNADGNACQIHRHIMVDSHRIARAVLAFNVHGDRACGSALTSAEGIAASCAVRQHGGWIGFIVYGDGQRCARRQAVA